MFVLEKRLGCGGKAGAEGGWWALYTIVAFVRLAVQDLDLRHAAAVLIAATRGAREFCTG